MTSESDSLTAPMSGPDDVERVRPGLRARDLTVVARSGHTIIEGVSLELGSGEILGLVGESGSGKTTTALALLGSLNANSRFSSGTVEVNGVGLPVSDDAAMRRFRGKQITYVPQNPGGALNPSMRIGDTIKEMLTQHGRAAGPTDVESALHRVGLPNTPAFQRRYPHQLSGGQQQRICISVAIVGTPPIVVLDEPTTGLDVLSQQSIIEELRRIRADYDLTMVYVSHDLAVVAQIADRLAVMYAGRIVEEGPALEVLRTPRHPYTRGLLNSIPDHRRPAVLQPMAGIAPGIRSRPRGCAFTPRCPIVETRCESSLPELEEFEAGRSARCVRVTDTQRLLTGTAALRLTARSTGEPVLEVAHLRAEHRGRTETVVAASDVSFTVHRGECVALVGESGSGKTTIGRAIAGLHATSSGAVRLNGTPIAPDAARRSREQRRLIQMVFQNAKRALNPRTTVGQAIARPARFLRDMSGREVELEVTRLMDLVRLPGSLRTSRPTELSGGECQRVAIARALAADPSVLVCDEITSALDVSVQAAVIDLLNDMRQELGLSLLFITHDLGVVATLADHVLVLQKGLVSESGSTTEVLESPRHPYTRELMAAAPTVSDVLATRATP